MKKLLLISNKVMHYRVSVYNYFYRRFKEYGWDFIVRSDELQKANRHHIEFDYKSIGFTFGAYKKEIEELKPDAVIIFLHIKDFVIWPLIYWLKFKGIPIIFWTKGQNLDNPDNILSSLLYKHLHNKFDGIILYSKHEIKYIKEKNRYKVSVANNTINFEDFPKILETREQIKKELGIPFNKVVLSVGRMDAGGQRKNVHHLIEIFNNITNKELGLVIVGSMNRELVKKIDKNNIIYLGEVHDPLQVQISKLFKMSDLFSIPGHVGLGLNQAFFWGLPVVTENCLQPPEIHYLVNGRNGFIVPRNDITELRNKILYLLENDDKRQEFSINARNDILEHASVENMFEGFKQSVDLLSI